MPLVRVQVRNEYGLGMQELYKEADKEDPKALLDGVAVSGLVGILRQLGDLAEFAAEVFHGLQEQVMDTSSRSHKLMVRVQNIEAAFPPLEKTILAQRSHLHFAYTTGLQWHVRFQSERNHFIHSDLPRFIMDLYEECRGPPSLHLLDKFDLGGPGSCLKRFTDPTFYRRASTGFDEAYVEKVPRDKKARRRKKKKTWLKNGGALHSVSNNAFISSNNDRMQYDSGNFDGQTSPSQTVSTFDPTLKSELAEPEPSNSFNSRAASGYIECIFSPSTMKPDGNDPEEINPQLNIHHSDTVDASSIDEQRRAADYEIQEQTDTRSSCVTWDEKTEIEGPIELHYHSDEMAEMLPTNFNPDPPEGETVNIGTVDQMEFKFDDENMLASVFVGKQLDDIESETDNYMDALNTIESESETDLECQTKREVGQFSSLNSNAVYCGLDELTPSHYSDSRFSNCKTHVPADVSSSKAVAEENHNPVSLELPEVANSFVSKETSVVKPVTSEFYTTENPPQEANVSLSQNTLSVSDHSGTDVLYGSNVETSERNVSLYSLGEPILQGTKIDTILCSSHEPQKSPSFHSGVSGINFWTNGGLLGLQPSKPPDFSGLNSVDHDSVANSKGETVSPSSGSVSFEGDKNASNETINPDLQATKSCEYGDTNSSRMFKFSNGLLVNGFQRKESQLGCENTQSSIISSVSEAKNVQAYRTFPGRNVKEKFGSGSSFMSPSSSPPLEHMKIYFQPINVFETHRLKLKFPDGSQCQESNGELFPSFQLVPEQSISLPDFGSDSDDDTFCRSSPHLSDDCLSHNSESDSLEWETGESPRCKDDEIYDALGRISTTESVSSNLESGRTTEGLIAGKYGFQNSFIGNGMEPSYSGRLLDLPCFDSLDTSLEEEKIHPNSDGKYPLESDFFKEPTPSPPPLPPVEWRAMKENPDGEIMKQDSSFEALKNTFEQKFSAATIPHQPKPAPIKLGKDTKAMSYIATNKQLTSHKLNGRKDDNQPTNSKGVDEKEDFLKQIRSKSFSLRRTINERPPITPVPPANVSVTAILEKANAIRQAVGSDDGEDNDTWSDV